MARPYFLRRAAVRIAGSDIDAVTLLHLAHHEGALNGGETLNLAQFVEHELLILLHIACAYLQ